MTGMFSQWQRFCLIILIIVVITGITTTSSLATVSDSNQPSTGINLTGKPVRQTNYILYQTWEGIGCRNATPTELPKISKKDPNTVLRPLNRPHAEQSSAGLKIILRGTSQLEKFPEAKAAFIRAAANWEAIITTPITVVIDVDFGATRFGTPYLPGVIGATDPQEFAFSNFIKDVRERLISQATSASDTTIFTALPSTVIPTDQGDTGNLVVSLPQLRALNFVAAIANPAAETQFGDPPSIGFNSNFTFDFNPDDEIDIDKTDFVATATHEIGHALGFTSVAGNREIVPTFPIAPTLWDLYRFRPGTTMATFTTAARILSSGGEQNFFAGNDEVALSTGRINGTGGDGAQSSHWKARQFTGGNRIGIMEPFLTKGERVAISANDIAALRVFGYKITPNDTIAPLVKVTAPNNNEVLIPDTQFTIKWDASDNVQIASQSIALSTNGGASFDTVIATGLSANQQSFNWNIPASLMITQGRIRITAVDTANNIASDISDTNFSIKLPNPDFALNFDSANIEVQRGRSSEITLNINRMGGFSENVTVTAPDTKALKIKFSQPVQSSAGTTVSFSFKVKKKAPLGTQTLNFTGTDSTGRVRTATLMVLVKIAG